VRSRPFGFGDTIAQIFDVKLKILRKSGRFFLIVLIFSVSFELFQYL